MSSIYNSDRKIEQFFLGSQEITEMFLGNELVFSKITNNLFYKLHEFVGSLTVQNTIEAPVKSAILCGSTKYKDVDTDEILETFEEGRNLELVSVKMPVLTTTGKNLVEKLMYGNVSTGGNIADNMNQKRVRTDYINIQNEEKITIKTHSGEVNRSISFFYDENKKFISQTSWSPSITNSNGFTTLIPSNTKYVICEFTHNLPSDKDLVLSNIKIQIEKGDTATFYEPYKSNILTVNEEVELHGIGEVKDELNLLTGELTERVGEIVLNGDENWSLYGSQPNQVNTVAFKLSLTNHVSSWGTGLGYCDKLSFTNGGVIFGQDLEGVTTDANNIIVRVSKSKASSVNEFKAWLSNNSIRVVYPLKEEAIKTVDLSSNTVYAYNGTTHYTCSSEEGSLIPTACIEVPVETETVE